MHSIYEDPPTPNPDAIWMPKSKIWNRQKISKNLKKSQKIPKNLKKSQKISKNPKNLAKSLFAHHNNPIKRIMEENREEDNGFMIHLDTKNEKRRTGTGLHVFQVITCLWNI